MSLSLFSLLSVYWCSYLSNELGINQWPLTLENGCEWCRYNICRHSLGQMPWDWDVLHCRLQSKPQGLHHLTERVTGNSQRKRIETTENVVLHDFVTLGCILSVPVTNWAWPRPSLANPLMRAELAPSPIPKEKHLQHSCFRVRRVSLWFKNFSLVSDLGKKKKRNK